jgi:hypothetical protein
MRRPEPSGSNPVGRNMEVGLRDWFYSQLESIDISLDQSLRLVDILVWALEVIQRQLLVSLQYLAEQLGFWHRLDLELPIHPDPSPSFDPADVLITHCLKDWIEGEDIPWWIRTRVLEKANQPSITSNWAFVLRMTLKWVVSSGLGLISLLISDETQIFVPSSDFYCFRPPHTSPCIVHARVRDTFLLESGLYGAIG